VTRPEDSNDARVEPASDLSADEAAIASGLPPVSVLKARSRERIRNVVSIVIVCTTLGCGIAIAVAAFLGSDRADDVAQLVFTPLIGLLGAIVGFYFGGQDSTA
jgi:hypothetical protein